MSNSNNNNNCVAIATEESYITDSTSHSILNSQSVFTKYTVGRGVIHRMLYTDFHFKDKFLPVLGRYYILHWSGTQFLNRMKDGMILIAKTNETVQYKVIYDTCTPESVKAAKQIRLSFRAAKNEIGLPAYVIIQVITAAN